MDDSVSDISPSPASATDKPLHASYVGAEALPEDEHRVPGSRSKNSIETKQQETLKRRAGNPNLQKGVIPYNVTQQSLAEWLALNPSYVRKTPLRRSSQEIVRMFLEEVSTRKGRTTTLEKGGKERLIFILEDMFRTATNGKSKNQVTAATLLLQYAYGKPKSSDADLDAIKKGGLTVVYVNRPEIDPSIPIADNEQKQLGAPEFIEGEFSEDESNGR